MQLKRPTKLIAVAVAGALVLTPALAPAAISLGDDLGTSLEAIRAKLEKEGYRLTEIEFEDREIEIEVTKDGQAMGIVITEAGKVIEMELEEQREIEADDDEDED